VLRLLAWNQPCLRTPVISVKLDSLLLAKRFPYEKVMDLS
jgi:hypothetical protein